MPDTTTNTPASNDALTTVLKGTGYTTDDSRSVFANIMQNYGFNQDQIGSLLNSIVKWGTTYSPSQIVNDLLPTTQEYQQRFAGNAARVKNGLSALSPAEYIANENSYRTALQSAGLPKGFYDSQDAINKLISSDVSPTEFNDRIRSAQTAIAGSDPYYTQSLQEMYGLDNGHMIAHLLDPTAAAPIVERQAAAAAYGAAALRQGLTLTPDQTQQFEQYASGVGTGVNAEQGMQQIASMLPTVEKLGNISGQNYDQNTAQQEVFGGLASAQRARENLLNQEQSRFTGRSNITSQSLAGGTAGLL
jgi:hypothetical protein